MVSVFEYNRLKDSRYNIQQNIKYSDPSPEKKAELSKQLKQVEQAIQDAEKTELITKYLDLLKRKIRLQQTIGSWKYYKKDTTKMEENLATLIKEIEAMEADPTQSVAKKPEDLTITQDLSIPKELNDLLHKIAKQLDGKSPSTQVTAGSEPTYYIINLAWSKDDGRGIVNMVRDFLNMSNYSETYSDISDEREEHVITWKFTYDTLEEQANVKALKMAATHMLDTLKTWYTCSADAEVFGKVQKY